MRVLYKYLVLLVALAHSQIVLAEPTPTIKYLMNETVTMLDWGLYKLNKDMSKEPLLEGMKPQSHISVNYNWEHDKIRIVGTPPFHRFQSEKAAQDWCKEFVNNIRTFFGVDPSTGEVRATSPTYIYTYFVHQGFKKKNQPKNLGEDLDRLVEIVATALVSVEIEKTMVIRCTAPLLGSEIFLSESSKTPRRRVRGAAVQVSDAWFHSEMIQRRT